MRGGAHGDARLCWAYEWAEQANDVGAREEEGPDVRGVLMAMRSLSASLAMI